MLPPGPGQSSLCTWCLRRIAHPRMPCSHADEADLRRQLELGELDPACQSEVRKRL